MADSKLYEYNLDGVKFTAELTIGESGEVQAKITMLEGQADFNTVYWGDDSFLGDSATVNNPNHEPIDLEAAGITCQDVQFDHAQKISAPGFEWEGTGKPTFLEAGETGYLTLSGETSLDNVDVLGFWGTNASTPDGEMNAVAGEGLDDCGEDTCGSAPDGEHDDDHHDHGHDHDHDHDHGHDHGGDHDKDDEDCDGSGGHHDGHDHDGHGDGERDKGDDCDDTRDHQNGHDGDDDGKDCGGWGKWDRDDHDQHGGKTLWGKGDWGHRDWGKDSRDHDKDEDCDDDDKSHGGWFKPLGGAFGGKLITLDPAKFYESCMTRKDPEEEQDRCDRDEDDDHDGNSHHGDWHCFL